MTISVKLVFFSYSIQNPHNKPSNREKKFVDDETNNIFHNHILFSLEAYSHHLYSNITYSYINCQDLFHRDHFYDVRARFIA